MKTKQDIFNMNLDFAVLRDLIYTNGGFDYPIRCSKCYNRWMKQLKYYSKRNELYILTQQSFSSVGVIEN